MSEDPIALWRERYKYEEAIHSESDVIGILRNSPETREAISLHIRFIENILSKTPGNIFSGYAKWVTNPESYNFGSEAHYQGRILFLLASLANIYPDIVDRTHQICARQTINPSSFNGSPRIIRMDAVSYILFPAPTVYWMYAICSMIVACSGKHKLNRAKLDLYLRYIIASRSFERAATIMNAPDIDFLVDEIVHQGDVEDVDGLDEVPNADTMNMVSAIEDFVICHELAHLLLGHDDSNPGTEMAADKLALDLLQSLPESSFRSFPVEDLSPRHFPQLGYLSLYMWKIVRLSAEQRVLTHVFDTPEQIASARVRIEKLWSERRAQIDLVEKLPIEVPPSLRAIADGAVKLVEEIGNIDLDRAEIHRIRTLARTLGHGDYSELRQKFLRKKV